MFDARITGEPVSPQTEFDTFMTGLDEEGAAVRFVGITRGKPSGGARIERVFLDHHPTLSPASVRDIAGAARRRFAVSAIRVVHRYGVVQPGEAIVFVAAAAAHRRAAFEAADYIMDRLKTEAVFWKREDAADGSRWIEPAPTDYADTARWSD